MTEFRRGEVALNRTRLAIASVLVLAAEPALLSEVPNEIKIGVYLVTAAIGFVSAWSGINAIDQSRAQRPQTLSRPRR